MKSKIVRCSKRCFSLILSFSLIFGLIGCSPSNDQPDNPDTYVTASPDSEVIADPVPEDTRISDNGQPIYDFDEFINGDWYKERSGNSESVTYLSEEYYNYIELVKDLLESSNLSSLNEDDALYKVVSLYYELKDRSEPDARLESIRKYLEPINQAQSFSDLYKLYSIPEYAIFNNLIDINVKPDYYWDNIAFVSPYSRKEFFDVLKNALDENSGDMTLRSYLNDLGYDDSRITEIIDNAYDLEDDIALLLNSDEWDSDFYFYNSETAAEEGLNVPVFDIVGSLNGYGTHGYILCKSCIFDFYNDLYVAENFEKIKDYYILASLWIVYFSGYDFLEETQSGRILNGDELAVVFLMDNAPDVIANEVIKKYFSDSEAKDINSLLLQIKASAINVIGDTDWLSDDAKNLAKIKISRMTQYIGQNGHNYYLNGYVMDGDVINDMISLKAEALRFKMIQSYFSDTDRAPFGPDVNTCNAFYIRQYNCFLVCAGLISNPVFTEAESFEEKLGKFGSVAAHEIGHSSDSMGILYNETGYYDPILTDDDYDSYNQKLDLIKKFFDGKTVYDDYVISGELICDETYADLFAVQTCLNILSDMENADYDKFFRAYASSMSGLYGESDIDLYANDTHLMAKARINFVLGQFDEFYETYDIDESSPYFVPENERLRIF